MTLQQLRYLIAIAEYGSINAAAHNLYASQSNLSTAIKELEGELGITIFTRSNRGVTLTNDGTELLGYARQVVEQADMLEERYAKGDADHTRLAISTQHYAFSVQAFMKTADAFAGSRYDFILRECATGEIIDDVRTFRSEAGILFTDDFNRRVLTKAFEDANVSFHPLFDARVHVFVGEDHPLACKSVVKPADLEPFPRYSLRAGVLELLLLRRRTLRLPAPRKEHPHLRPRHPHQPAHPLQRLHHFDRRPFRGDAHGIASIPLEAEDVMRVGYIMHNERKPSALLQSYISNLRAVVRENPTVDAYIAEDAAENG